MEVGGTIFIMPTSPPSVESVTLPLWPHTRRTHVRKAFVILSSSRFKTLDKHCLLLEGCSHFINEDKKVQREEMMGRAGKAEIYLCFVFSVGIRSLLVIF